MTNPNGHDEYITQLKTKYIKGLVKTAYTSVATTGESTVYSTGSLKCDTVFETIDSAGTTYYIPAYTVGTA